jgi:23S rRNA U2552 (ribose-2'-O)-methylase RlmE/FtsJ
MYGDLPTDVIGTNPKYPSIVDHSWLSVDPAKYDNYPSDNNPVRVVPKLHDLWNHSPAQAGINLIPNTTVMPLGVRSAEEDDRNTSQVVKEAKKAAMAGMKGKEISQYLRARFSPRYLEKAAGELKKVSEEVGLLGNVYIDASAFNSYNEAESFVKMHRNRLARDILLQTDSMSPNVVSLLASTFHKNVVSSIDYNEQLFKKYKDHLVSSGRITPDFVIDSKESLRKAFLQEKAVVRPEPVEVKPHTLSESEIASGLEKMATNKVSGDSELADSLKLSTIIPVVSFIQENISKGKTVSSVKDMLRSRFVLADISSASEAISVVLSKEGLSDENINQLISDGKISFTLGTELKKVGKRFPLKKATIEESKSTRQVGVPGYFYNPKAKDDSNETYRNASVEALKKGIELSRIKEKLLQKLSATEADTVLADAVSQMNALPAGLRANQPEKPKKVALVVEPEPKKTLPDPKTIIPQTQEILGFFEGAQMEVQINSPFSRNNQEVGGLLNSEGISEVL